MTETPGDFKEAARQYPKRMSPTGRHYLMTKPFGPTPWGDLFPAKIHDLAFLVEVLALPAGASILEIGCGPGWIPMYLAMVGYRTVGVDIAPEMIRIARKRVRGIRFPPERRGRVDARFEVGDAESFELEERFDGIVIYDSLHHYEEPGKVLQRAFHHLRPGGKLLVKEPPADHAESPVAQQEMEQFGVLEQGFSEEFIRDLLEEAGFQPIRSLGLACLAVDRNAPPGYVQIVVANASTSITFLASRPGPGALDSLSPGVLRAELEVRSLPERAAPGETLRAEVRARNSGDTLWRHRWQPEGGFVRLGVDLYQEGSRLQEDLARAHLREDVPAGGETSFAVELAAPTEPGAYELRFDLVSELISWFRDRGGHPPTSHPLIVQG